MTGVLVYDVNLQILHRPQASVAPRTYVFVSSDFVGPFVLDEFLRRLARLIAIGTLNDVGNSFFRSTIMNIKSSLFLKEHHASHARVLHFREVNVCVRH